MRIITEGKTQILIEPKKVVDKKMPVFYNPIMVVNRDFSLLVLNALNKKDLTIADPLAGSGIRTIRILKELNITKKIITNDIKTGFIETLNKNLSLNDMNLEKEKTEIIIKNEDANKTLNTQGHFDYIEIDPFGTPNPFLDSAIRALRRNSILSVTATDTSALCGSYPLACERKYWAKPLRNELMHEFAVRILIRKIQLIGSQHEKALIPLISIANDHYIKIFFETSNSKTKTDEILKQHEYFEYEKEKKGPIWIGEINNYEFIKKIMNAEEKLEISEKTKKLLLILEEESQIKQPFFYDVHELASELKATIIPKLEQLINELKNKGYEASRTHFKKTGIKTNSNKETMKKIFKELIKK